MNKRIILLFGLLMGIPHLQAQENIVTGEYFWDIDPGVGFGTSFSTGSGTDLTVDFYPSTAGLSDGNHLIGFRTKKANGHWGETEILPIHIHQFVAAEYFFDVDPGPGNATPATFSSTSSDFTGDITLNSAITVPGNHLLGVRSKSIGGKWGITSTSSVWIADYSPKGEYFWNTDPGVGNGTPFTLSNTSSNFTGDVTISNIGLNSGYQNLYIRTRAASGDWSLPRLRKIWIADNIVGGEYFWDTDPGVGNGSPIPVYIASDESVVCGEFNTNGLSLGEHYLYVRSVSAKGAWSHPTRIQFDINDETIVVGCPGDFDRNGSVNTSDLLLFLGSFGTSGGCSFDLTGDFTVNTTDLLLFLGAYGSFCQ